MDHPRIRDIPTRLEIERLADAFRTRVRRQRPPVDVEALALLAGINDITVDQRVSGSALLIGGLSDGYAVVLKQGEPRVRHRFSIAHEIGHRVVHPDRLAHETVVHVAARRTRDGVERACDHFAACLLMPREWVNAEVARGSGVTGMARTFDVSVDAIRVRLRELGYHNLADQPRK